MLGIMYIFHHWTCRSSNDGKCLCDLTIFRISPALTQTCENKGFPAFQADVPGYFSAIDQLPPRQREVVQLRLLGELTLEEISNTVGLTLGGVKSTLHNAMRALRKELADLERGAYVHM